MTNGEFQDENDDEVESPQSSPTKNSPRIEPEFLPQHLNFAKSMNQRAIHDRAAVLFDPTLDTAPERPRGIFASSLAHNRPENFKIVPSEFLRRARRSMPREPQATASAFSQWIYSLYGKADGDDEDRERGRMLEKCVLEQRRFAYCCVDNNYLRSAGSNWTLVHNGMHGHDREHEECFTVRHLAVNGVPLRASPDLIYFNRRNSEVIIVEIKNSRLHVPNNLWPNIWGQLWCYSQIQQALDIGKITVIGEIWGDRLTGYDKVRRVYLRASVRRDPRAPTYDRFFRKLFDIYRGA